METPVLEIRALGPLDIRVGETPLPHVRTQKCLWLLAFLALHQGRFVSREVVAEALWPESSPDKARDNLRYILRDLRQVLGDGNAALHSTPLALSLGRERCWSDVAAFDEGMRLQVNTDVLRTTLDLYRGPFVAGCLEDWVEAPREERSLLYLGGIESLAARLPAPEAIPLLEKALSLRPLRESIVRALMNALAQTGNHAEMAQVFHDLRARLPLRQTPDPETVALYEELRRHPIALPRSDRHARHRPPGGAVRLDSALYVGRPADAQILRAIDDGESIVRLKGSRQCGKSSLLARAIEKARRNGARVRHSDVAHLGEGEVESLESFVAALLRSLDEDAPPLDARYPPLVSLERQVGRELDAAADQRFVWAIDGIDRLFPQPYCDEFFSKIRAWHNKGAVDFEGPFSRLTVALAYSTEAKRFIVADDRSPFNVGVLRELADFSREEQETLNDRLGCPLKKTSDRERFRALVGGHPYLNHLGLDALARGEADLAVLESSDVVWDGNPFRANLWPLLRDLESAPELQDAARRLLRGENGLLDDDQLFRLAIAGLVVGDTAATARIRCGLYERLLRRFLHE